MLERAEVISHLVLNKYCRNIQIYTLDEDNNSDFLTTTIRDELSTFKRELSDIKDDIHLLLPWDFTDIVKNRLKEEVNEANPEVVTDLLTLQQQQSSKKHEEETERKLTVEQKEVESGTDTQAENPLEQIKEEFRKEHEVVLTYLAWVAPFVAEGYLEDKSSAKSPAKMNETRTAVNNEIVAYLKVTVAQLEKMFSEYQGRESATRSRPVQQVIQNMLKRVTFELRKGLKYSTASYRNKLRWYMNSKNKTSEVKTLAEWCLESESSSSRCVTQVIEFLVNRRMNVIRLQAIQAQFDSQKIHQRNDISDDLKSLYEDAFKNIPQLYITDKNNQFIKFIEKCFTEVYQKKLLLQLEDNPSKKNGMLKELKEIEKRLMEEKTSYKFRVSDLTNILTFTVSDQVRYYGIIIRDYEYGAKLLSPKVLEIISEEVKTYFGLNRINEVITFYVQLYCEMVAEVGKTGTERSLVSVDDIFPLGKILWMYLSRIFKNFMSRAWQPSRVHAKHLTAVKF